MDSSLEELKTKVIRLELENNKLREEMSVLNNLFLSEHSKVMQRLYEIKELLSNDFYVEVFKDVEVFNNE